MVFEFGERSLLVRDACEARRIAQAKGGVFVENQFVHAPVVFKRKRVVACGDEQHVVDALRHEAGKWRVAQHDFSKVGQAGHGKTFFS